MKLNTLAIAAAASLGFVGYANAQCTTATATHIYITGSTAFRGATIAAIEACLQPGFNYAAYKEAGAAAPYANLRQTASYVNYYGNLAADSSCVVIKCAFSGSEAGYLDMIKCTTQKEAFMADTIGGFGVANIDSASTPATTDSHVVDIAMADNTQAFAKPANRTPVINNICAAGVVPFVWVKNAQTAGDIAANPDYNDLVNVTEAQLRVAITSGTKLSLFTGVPGENKWVYVAGRDNNSGTRANCLLDLGYPVTQAVNQTQIGGVNGAPTLGALSATGQSSGGTLAKSMFITGSASTADTINGGTGWYAIAYLGIADATTAIGGGAVQLTLSGVAESTTAIEQGQYSYWGQEQCALANCDTLSSEAGLLWSCMCSEFPLVTTPGVEIPLTAMHATKTPDSADPVHN